jgi:hypothetical protein
MTRFKHFFSSKIYRPLLAILSIQQDLFYIHIGKTGGTSVQKNLLQSNGKKAISNHIKSLKKPYRLVFLNHWPSHFKILKSKDINIACFVRDPVDRLESAFYYEQNHWLRGESPPNKNLLKFQNFTDFALALIDSENSQNQIAFDSYQNAFHLSKGYTFYFSSKTFLKERNINFKFVGEIQTFESDIKKFAILLNMKLGPLSQKHNINSSKPSTELTQGIRARLKVFLQKEYDIYDYILSQKEK